MTITAGQPMAAADVLAAIPVPATASPVMDGTAGVGASARYARQDHTHPTDTSRYAASNPANYQTATQVSATLTGLLPVASNNTPIMDGVGTVGSSPFYARADHVHASDTSRYAASNPAGYQTAAQVTTTVTGLLPVASNNTPIVAGVGAVGTSLFYARADHVHPAGASVAPATVAPLMNGAAAVGTSVLYARQDHIHASDTSRAPLASPTFTGTVTAPLMQTLGSPTINFAPVGNGFSTNGCIVQQGTTTSTNLREFAISAGLESHTGFGGSTGGINADKVGIYSGIEGFASSGDIWALNSVTRMVSGFPATGNALGYEIDFNNEAADRGATIGLSGFAAPVAYGLLVTGSGTFGSTAAISVQGGTGTIWHRGLGVASGVSDHAFYDYSNANTSFAITGSHAGWGIDMKGAVLGGAIRLPNNSGMLSSNAANTADIAVAAIDTGNNLLLGTTSGGGSKPGGIVMGVGIYPSISNTYTCGIGSNLWSTVYAATGTINTSDARLKTDIAALPDCLEIVKTLQPKTYKWRVGGHDIIDDEPVARPGKRTHWGFLASDIKAVMDTTGQDFAGYVRMDDGTEAMRPDQLIPVLWKALQELAATVAALTPPSQPPTTPMESC